MIKKENFRIKTKKKKEKKQLQNTQKKKDDNWWAYVLHNIKGKLWFVFTLCSKFTFVYSAYLRGWAEMQGN